MRVAGTLFCVQAVLPKSGVEVVSLTSAIAKKSVCGENAAPVWLTYPFTVKVTRYFPTSEILKPFPARVIMFSSSFVFSVRGTLSEELTA